MKIIIAFSLCCTLMCAASAHAKKQSPNIIYLIGDGMGAAYTSAYRYYHDDPATADADRTIFDEMFVGMASSYPHDDHYNVTDSAAAATALATGIKTFNGAVGVDNQQQPVYSLMDVAKQNKYLTGIAVTSHVVHATPAAFVAHVGSRASHDNIADQYVDLRINGKPKVDLLLGAGKDYFIRQDRNLVKELKALGYTYEDDWSRLGMLNRIPALGLFADSEMPSALDGEEPTQLAKMAQKSLALLQGKPFFLLLEASQIDWCGHINDIACAMAEMHDMAETMKVIKAFVDKHPNTVFVATADHSTGGLSLGTNNQYNWFPRVVKRIKATSRVIPAKLLAQGDNWYTEWQQLTGLTLTEAEQQAMQIALAAMKKQHTEETQSSVQQLVLGYFNKYTSTGWTTNGHTGEDVQVFSYGMYRHLFEGAMDNTDIHNALLRCIQ